MQHIALEKQHRAQVTQLFRQSFTEHEGADEGDLIAQLVHELSGTLNHIDPVGYATLENDEIIGAILFTRLEFSSPVSVYLLSPVAVATEHQQKGVGQALIRHGLNALKTKAVSVVITYGDPNFYGKVGFEPLPESVIKAPMPLSHPIGWQGQSLQDGPIPTLQGQPTCHVVFRDPALW